MKCFTTTSGAKLRIYAGQPVYNSSVSSDYDNVGHSFITIEQDGVSRTIGFYPQGETSPFFPDNPGQLRDNAGHEWDHAVSFDINPGELADLLYYVSNVRAEYHLDTNNCTNWVVGAAASINVSLPQNESTWLLGGEGYVLDNLDRIYRVLACQIDGLPTWIMGWVILATQQTRVLALNGDLYEY